MKKLLAMFALTGMFAVGCTTPPAADVASENLSTAADNFEINRRIVFYNGITDSYMLEVTGLCSIQDDVKLTITCKTGDGKFVKHFLGRADNVTYFAEQIGSADASVDHYRVIFRPQTILPSVELG